MRIVKFVVESTKFALARFRYKEVAMSDPWKGMKEEIQAYMQSLVRNDKAEEWTASDLANEAVSVYNLWRKPYDKNQPYPVEVLEYADTLLPE